MTFAHLWLEKKIVLRQYLPRCRLFWTFCKNFLGSRFFHSHICLFLITIEFCFHFTILLFTRLIMFDQHERWNVTVIDFYMYVWNFLCAGCVQNLVCIFVSFSLFQFRTRNAESPVFPNIVKASFSSVCYIIL